MNNSGQQVVTAVVPESNSATTGADDGASQPQGQPAPALPPAPSNLLYHLHHPQSGDHFVTIDPAAASEYEGRGYVGGAIARVYARPEDGTKPISTNGGGAYIFTSREAKTEPRVRVIALYYAAKGGDFFYTTDRTEASSGDWTTTLVGYVGTP